MPAIDPEQAKLVFQAIVLTALADGHTSDEEAKLVAKLRKTDPVIQAVVDPAGAGLEIRDRLKAKGLDECAQEIAAGITERSLQEKTFVLCAEVMEADHDTAIEEALLLGTFQELFRFTPEDVKRLITESSKA